VKVEIDGAPTVKALVAEVPAWALADLASHRGWERREHELVMPPGRVERGQTHSGGRWGGT